MGAACAKAETSVSSDKDSKDSKDSHRTPCTSPIEGFKTATKHKPRSVTGITKKTSASSVRDSDVSHDSSDGSKEGKAKSVYQRQQASAQFRQRLAKTKELKDHFTSGEDAENPFATTSSSEAQGSCKLPSGGEEWDPKNECHELIVNVVRFVNGDQCPPEGTAKYPTEYMEQNLATRMEDFQEQMSEEITTCGFQQDISMEFPEMVTFWEMSNFYPSAEDSTLRVFDIIALVTDGGGGEATCLADLNVYIAGDRVSGFTLNSVDLISRVSVAECSAEVSAKLKKIQAKAEQPDKDGSGSTGMQRTNTLKKNSLSSEKSDSFEREIDFLGLAYGKSDREVEALKRADTHPRMEVEDISQDGVAE